MAVLGTARCMSVVSTVQSISTSSYAQCTQVLKSSKSVWDLQNVTINWNIKLLSLLIYLFIYFKGSEKKWIQSCKIWNIIAQVTAHSWIYVLLFWTNKAPNHFSLSSSKIDILKVPDGLENNNQTHLVSHLPMYTSLDYTWFVLSFRHVKKKQWQKEKCFTGQVIITEMLNDSYHSPSFFLSSYNYNKDCKGGSKPCWRSLVSVFDVTEVSERSRSSSRSRRGEGETPKRSRAPPDQAGALHQITGVPWSWKNEDFGKRTTQLTLSFSIIWQQSSVL